MSMAMPIAMAVRMRVADAAGETHRGLNATNHLHIRGCGPLSETAGLPRTKEVCMRARIVLSFCLLASSIGLAVAQEAPPPAPASASPATSTSADGPTLDTIVVAGRQPGPGLWKVSKGDHVMWILGTQSPLPKRMDWDSAVVVRRVGEAQEVLLPPTSSVHFNVGFFRGLTLLPAAMKIRDNPDGKTLQEVVPPADYARWLALKQRWIGSDRSVEEWRPVFAAIELYVKAIERSGMTLDTGVTDLVKKTAKSRGLVPTQPKVEITVQDPKGAMKEFSHAQVDDLACFRGTMDRIDGDLGAMAARANAWATGDIEALRDVPYRTQFAACSEALTGNAVARKQGMGDLEAQLERKWLDAAESALARNTTTFAVLGMGQLLETDGYLAKLAAKGYVIEEP